MIEQINECSLLYHAIHHSKSVYLNAKWFIWSIQHGTRYIMCNTNTLQNNETSRLFIDWRQSFGSAVAMCLLVGSLLSTLFNDVVVENMEKIELNGRDTNKTQGKH